MKIKNHLLFYDDDKQVPFFLTPNSSGQYEPKFLLLHYTAATTAESAINWFKNPIAKAAAHLVIGRDGSLTQCAPFNVVTWHAGKSRWKGIEGLNKHAIGIELVNAGRLTKSGSNFICPVDRKIINADEVLTATHKNEIRDSFWHEYAAKQLEISLEVATLLADFYQLDDILGHEDVSPIRKSDPGPAFPMSSFRSRALGRENEILDEFITSAALNIRSGPGTTFLTLAEPLPKGTKVLVLKTEGNWSFVEVLDVVDGIMDLEGWVASKHLS